MLHFVLERSCYIIKCHTQDVVFRSRHAHHAQRIMSREFRGLGADRW